MKSINKFEIKNWLVFLLAIFVIALGLWLTQNYQFIGSASILSEKFNFPIFMIAGLVILVLTIFMFLEVKKSGNARKLIAKLTVPAVFILAFSAVYIGQSIKYQEEIQAAEAYIKIIYQRCNDAKYVNACDSGQYPVVPNRCWGQIGSNMTFNCFAKGSCALCYNCRINSLGLADCDTPSTAVIAQNLCLGSSRYRDGGYFCSGNIAFKCSSYTESERKTCKTDEICQENSGCVKKTTPTPTKTPTPTPTKKAVGYTPVVRTNVPKASATVKPIAITPDLMACGQKGCTNDNQCETGLPNFECDEKADSSQNVCVRICNSNQVRVDACTCTGDYDAITCGPIDINGDLKLNYIDLASFALSYFKKCNDSPYLGGGCGGKDVNGDGVINYIDLGSFALRYFPRSQNCLK